LVHEEDMLQMTRTMMRNIEGGVYIPYCHII
jgi:hypothetical protein